MGKFGVLGATGNVGKHVATALRNSLGDVNSVVLFTRTPTEGDNSFEADVGSDVATLQKSLQQCPDLVVLFVALPQAFSSEQMVSAGKVVAEVCALQHVAIVRLSSYAIDGGRLTQGPLGKAHLSVEAALTMAGVPQVSIRPTSFFVNADAYDVPSLCAEPVSVDDGDSDEQVLTVMSPLGFAPTACVNWVSCVDIGAVAAHQMMQLYDRLHKEDLWHVASGFKVVTNVSGGPSNSYRIPEYTDMLTDECRRARGVESLSVRYTELPVPSESQDYAGLWCFLRGGGFDFDDASAVEDATGRHPLSLREHLRAALA
jgi:hypothetical protein